MTNLNYKCDKLQQKDRKFIIDLLEMTKCDNIPLTEEQCLKFEVFAPQSITFAVEIGQMAHTFTQFVDLLLLKNHFQSKKSCQKIKQEK